MSGEPNLTGVWTGLYTYPAGHSVSFVATLIESGSALTGSTHEPNSLGEPGTLYATLIGSRAASSVSFVKSYDGGHQPYQNSVNYHGTLNGDATEIEGRWLISGVFSGTFLMIRESGKSEAVERRETVRA